MWLPGPTAQRRNGAHSARSALLLVLNICAEHLIHRETTLGAGPVGFGLSVGPSRRLEVLDLF